MTTTSVFQGNFLDKPSSRVLRPPGGGSSNIFGGAEEPAKPAAAQPVSPTEPVPSGEAPPAVAASEPTAQEPTEAGAQCGSGEPVAAEAASTIVEPQVATKGSAGDQANTRPKRMGYNPITGQAYEIPENPTKTSISVRQPPGGASSGLW